MLHYCLSKLLLTTTRKCIKGDQQHRCDDRENLNITTSQVHNSELSENTDTAKMDCPNIWKEVGFISLKYHLNTAEEHKFKNIFLYQVRMENTSLIQNSFVLNDFSKYQRNLYFEVEKYFTWYLLNSTDGLIQEKFWYDFAQIFENSMQFQNSIPYLIHFRFCYSHFDISLHNSFRHHLLPR